ncbi:hypothetical protein B296_00044527 [Ensete ventricosum]|uniref:Uncharacterized protein n=1 Tax=Ensete ventricosum TaxID=4639 RepID=A0A426XNC3_ENSVE|nr:hypothetical protein B296_00044527 [Ensete ventricosum]
MLSVHTDHRPPSQGRRPETWMDRSRLERRATRRPTPCSLSDRTHLRQQASKQASKRGGSRSDPSDTRQQSTGDVGCWLFTSPWGWLLDVSRDMLVVFCGLLPFRQRPTAVNHRTSRDPHRFAALLSPPSPLTQNNCVERSDPYDHGLARGNATAESTRIDAS